MTDELPKINPFAVPQSPARRPLCPWQEPDHLKYYVDVDNCPQVMDDFTSAMSDLTALKRHGQFVLVTGDARCGKSSIVNWCAHHALTRMKAEQLTPEPIDLTSTFDGEKDELDLEARRRMVGDRLVAELLAKGLLPADQRGYLEANRDRVDRVLLSLPGSLNSDNADSLVILLPDTEIPEEVIRYSSLLHGNILMIVESRWYVDDRVREIEAGARIPPIILNVGKLNSDDVQQFVDDRFRQSKQRGIHPQMSKEAIEGAVRRLDTIGQLHSTLHGTFEWKRRSGAAYDGSSMVSYQDILEYMLDELTLNRGRQDRDGRGHS